MQLNFTPHFSRSFSKAPFEIQKIFNKKSLLLLASLRHPSLRAKKYDESLGLWQARVNDDWRFYFTIQQDTYILHDIIRHPK